uniref:STI1/HOP DP domain-containing protein n=1 Tax=Tetradesmus obliquus TaxID=3088 RepID=A0A383W1I4_TETOB
MALRVRAFAAASAATSRPVSVHTCSARVAARRSVVAQAADMPDAMKQQMAQAMQDPAMAEKMRQMQEMMQRPEMQQQMAEMQAYMQNQQLQQRMQELRSDPEFKEMFEDIQKGGMGALMKYMNDPRVLAKLGSKLGDVPVPAPGAAAASAAAAAPPSAAAAAGVEIDNLFDAAKYGDVEAVEDFIAIGKDVCAGDGESRTPLHYAAGYNHAEIAIMLLEAGAKLEARDSKGNTPLHYAAGYGRPQLVELLLARGADAAATNESGKTAYELATLDERNPLTKEQAVLEKLKV